MKRNFRMVVSQQQKPGEGIKELAQHYCQAISGTRVPTLIDERKAVEKAAQGKAIFDQWTKVPFGIETDLFSCFRGVFVNGQYRGRASTYHFWQIAQE